MGRFMMGVSALVLGLAMTAPVHAGIGGEHGGRLTIVNKTGDVLYIFIDGQRMGTLGAFGTQSYTLHDPLDSNTYLEAYSTDHDAYVKTVGKPEVEYTWVIDEG